MSTSASVWCAFTVMRDDCLFFGLRNISLGLALGHDLPLLGLVHGDALGGVAFHLCGLGLAERVHIAVVIGNVRHDVRHDLVAHVLHVVQDALLHGVREGFPILVDFFYGERS